MGIWDVFNSPDPEAEAVKLDPDAGWMINDGTGWECIEADVARMHKRMARGLHLGVRD